MDGNLTIEVCKNKFGNVGLWNSIIKIVKTALENVDDIIIRCKDGHQFTDLITQIMNPEM